MQFPRLGMEGGGGGVLVRADGSVVLAPGEKVFKDSPVEFFKVVMTKIQLL